MKRMILGLFALMMAFTLTSTQAFAAGQQKDTSQSRFGQDTKKMSATEVPRASDLMDRKVKNDQGQDLGKVDDMILTKDGRISYLIVASGGVLGVGDKYIPVPFQSAQWNSDQRVVILPNMDKDKLQAAPTINKDDFAQLENPSFQQKVNTYYGEQATGQQPMQHQGQEQPLQQPGQMGR